MVARQIRLARTGEVQITWDDDHESVVSVRSLRDACPCAGCKGETILFQTYKPAPQLDLPGKYDLRNVVPVGRYALQMTWGDQHDSGIYTWEILRSLCECPVCRPPGIA